MPPDRKPRLRKVRDDLHGNASDQSQVVLLLIDVINDLSFPDNQDLVRRSVALAKSNETRFLLSSMSPCLWSTAFRRQKRSKSRSQKPQSSFRRRTRTNILDRKSTRLVCEPTSRNRRSAKPSSVL